MLRPWIEAVQLRRPPHDLAFDLPAVDRPVVIAGANGTGKTTLVEAIVACLFGADRKAGGAAAASRGDGTEAAAPEWCRVRLGRGDGRLEVRRDLATGVVVVRTLPGKRVIFDGDGDPSGRHGDARRYRQLLAEVLGVWDPDAFRRTLLVRQGELQATRLGDHLLRVALGGQVRFDAARREILAAYRTVTARPLHDRDRPLADARELERVEEEIDDLRHRLEAARAARERRGPLSLDRERVGERLGRLSEEIDRLEEAHAALLRGSATEVNARQLKELTRKLEQVGEAIGRASHRLDEAESALAAASAHGVYPADFAQRLARAELRWQDLDRSAGRPPLLLAALAILAFAGAIALAALDPAPWASSAALGAAAVGAVGAAAWLALWLDRRRVRARVRSDLAEILHDVPGGDTLGPASQAEAQARFESQAAATRARAEARAGLAAALRNGRVALRLARTGGVVAIPRPPQGDPPESGRDPVASVQAAVAAAMARTEERLLRERREMDLVGDVSLGLPDGVVPTGDGVAEALRERREERRRVQETLQELGQELLERGTPAESLDALEAAIAGLVPRRDALLRKADVLGAAHALLTDAYAAFRARDQERLIELVSRHVERLSDGTLGPVTADPLLENPRVRRGDAVLPLRSPPLSFGELHALLLAVRLGSADFLGGLGVFPPLILDDPFTHLDPARAALVWRLLEQVAEERQVIITTHDALLLDALQLQPDLLLQGDPPTAPPRSETEKVTAA